MQNHWVMDYETLSNCFIAVFEHYKEDKRRVFVIHSLTPREQFREFIEFLNENLERGEKHISYNGLSFDSQITQYILTNHEDWYQYENQYIAELIYLYAQRIIERQKDEQPDYAEWQLFIDQIDLFKMNHWDNVAKRSSLKWIQFSMDWDNVKDMPIHHSVEIKTVEEISTVVTYCINDVKSTKKILELSKEQLSLRKSLTEEYGINLYSASETKIAKELFLQFLSKRLGMPKHELRKMRTIREYVSLEECILPYISFTTKPFQELLEFYRGKVVTETKGALKYMVHYKGVDTYYGLGGVHGARESGIYEATEGYTLMSSDVISFYPNVAIRNKFAPAHLNKEDFCEVYEGIFEDRKKIPKTDPKNYVLKIVLNSAYGLSNDENSFLYDPKFTMSITINGQLLLTKLYEMLAEGIPGCIPITQNTDGLEMMIPTCFKQKYLDICREWEDLTSLQLEHDEYKKIIIGDVNSYIGIYANPEKKPKCKGRFEWEDQEKKKVAVLHKNKSFLIIPKALYAYFTKGVDPKDYLKENRNIFDYCGGVKMKGDWDLYGVEIKDGLIVQQKYQKVNRYYISKDGIKLLKRNKTDGREIQIESGKWLQTVVNKMEDKIWDENIDEDYYLQAIYKEINNIDKRVTRKFTQLELF